MKQKPYDLYLSVISTAKSVGGRHLEITALQAKPDDIKYQMIMIVADEAMTADLVIHVCSDEPITLTEAEQQKYHDWITASAKRVINAVPELVDYLNGGKPFDE